MMPTVRARVMPRTMSSSSEAALPPARSLEALSEAERVPPSAQQQEQAAAPRRQRQPGTTKFVCRRKRTCGSRSPKTLPSEWQIEDDVSQRTLLKDECHDERRLWNHRRRVCKQSADVCTNGQTVFCN